MDDDEHGGLLAGFLFGNIDESGNLENDILDDVSIYISIWFFFHYKRIY